MKNIPNRTWTLTPINGQLTSGGVTFGIPDQVIGLAATLIRANFVDLAWSAANNAAGYAIFLDGVLVASTPNLSYHLAGLSIETQYNITVAGINSLGQLGLASAVLDVTTGTAPEWLGTPFPLFEQGQIRSYALAAFIHPETAGTYTSTGTALPSGITLDTGSGVLTNDNTAAVSDVSTYAFSFDDGVNDPFTITNVRIQVIADQVPTVPTNPQSASITSTGFTLSWTASTDSDSNLVGYRVWRNGALYVDTGTTAVSLAVTGQTAGETNIWRISAYDALALESGRSAALSVQQSSSLPTWTANTPSYLPIVPGAACFGADQVGGSGRHLGGSNNAAIMFIDNLGTGTTGSFDSTTRIGYGTPRYCLNAAFPRHVIPLVAGSFNAMSGGSRNIFIDQPYLSLHAHAAPGHLYFRGTQWQTNGHNILLWHAHIMQDIYTDPAQADGSGDCASFISTPTPHHVLLANCGLQYATDETIGWFNAAQNMGVWQCIVTEPIQNGNHPEFPHNYGMILRFDVTPASVGRTVFAHCQARNPLTGSALLTVHNNIVYNFGDTGVQINNNPGSVPSDNNIEGNLFITGPNTNTNDAIRLYSAIVVGTRVYVADNRAIGISDALQSDLVQNDEGLTLSSSRLAGAYPAGAVVTTISDEAQFADLVMRHAGPKPLSRISSLQRTIDNINARISGVGNQGGFVSTPTTAGGYPSITPVGPIDPASPGGHWGGVPVPMTLGTRNVVQASGYTLIEEWSHGVASLFMPTGWDD